MSKIVVWTGWHKTEWVDELAPLGWRLDTEQDWRYHRGKGVDPQRFGRMLMASVRVLNPAVLVISKGYRDGWNVRSDDLSPVLDAGIGVVILDDAVDPAETWNLVVTQMAETADVLALSTDEATQKRFKLNTNAVIMPYPETAQDVAALLDQARVQRSYHPPQACCMANLLERLG